MAWVSIIIELQHRIDNLKVSWYCVIENNNVALKFSDIYNDIIIMYLHYVVHYVISTGKPTLGALDECSDLLVSPYVEQDELDLRKV